MPTKSTPLPSAPSSATIAPHSQYIKPALRSTYTTLIGEGGVFSVFLPGEIHQRIISSLAGKSLHESIAERIEFGFDNAEVVQPVADFPVAAVTTMAKISLLTYSRALMLAELYFQGNIGLTLGWLVSVSMDPKRWGIRPEKKEITLPWMKKPEQNIPVPMRLKVENQHFDLSGFPSQWPSSVDIQKVRETLGFSSSQASAVVGFSPSAIRSYELGKRGTRMHRYRLILLYVAWMKKNEPHRLDIMDETVRNVAQNDAMKLIQELQEDTESQVLHA